MDALAVRVEVLNCAFAVLFREVEALSDLLARRGVDLAASDDLEALDAATTEPAITVKDDKRALKGSVRVHMRTLTARWWVAYSEMAAWLR